MQLTSDPIPKLVRSIAIPASVGMVFQTLYNFVDTYFAGRESTDALAALTFSFPIFFLVIAFGNGLGQGTTALMGNALGAKETERSKHYFCQALLYCIGLTVLLTIGGLLSAEWLFRQQGAEGRTMEYSLQYMNVIMAGSGFFLLQTVLNAELNSRGNTKVYRNTLIVGFFANCVLDPWLMYGWLGVPALGVAGLAWATIACQVGTCAYMWMHLRRSELWQGVRAADFRPRWAVLSQITGQALPAVFNMLTVALGIFVIQYFLAKFSKEAVAAYGVATRIEQMLLLPAMGLNYAVISLAAQNYGAGRLDRVRETWLTTMRYGIAMMAVGGVLLWFTKGWLMSLFSKDATVIAHGSDYLGIAAITLAAYVILFQTVFLLQGMKRPGFALGIGLWRQIVAPLLVFNGLAYGLGWGLWGIWWGITIIVWSAALLLWFIGNVALQRATKPNVRSK
jgi:putative MATE family efflux protein